MNHTFTFTDKQKRVAFMLMGIGLLALISGLIFYKDNMSRVWANLLLDAVFFMGIAMGASFFVAAHYVAWGGWHVVLKRIPEAISQNAKFFGLMILVILAVGHGQLYEWTHKDIQWTDPADPNKGAFSFKELYLSVPFYFIRSIFFLTILLSLIHIIRKSSIREDLTGDPKEHTRMLKFASIFLIFFAVYISVSAWDWLMSIDAHWFSTMMGWYVFASFWVTSIAVVTLFVIYLKGKGYLQEVNENHLHDLGKYMFAFSIFWTYLTFCQYMLIWYANMPEETIYFKWRLEHFRPFFLADFFINFAVPFLVLMSRDAKRKKRVLIFVACMIIIGHFNDFWLMVMPGTVGESAGYGWLELLLPCLWIGILLFVTKASLTKASLVPKNHPYLEESLHHAN